VVFSRYQHEISNPLVRGPVMTSNDSRVAFDTRKAKWLFSQLGCMHPHITIIFSTCRCSFNGDKPGEINGVPFRVEVVL
jgi:hypothetical protein